MIRRILFSLLLLSNVTQPVSAQGILGSSKTPEYWANKIASAPTKYSYVGTFVRFSNNDAETSHIVHIADKTGEHERTELLDGPVREIVRHNDEVRSYFPGNVDTVSEKRWLRGHVSILRPKSLSSIDDNYLIKKAGKERISNYECQVILLEPKDNARYKHKLWADMRTGLLLKAAVIYKDQLIEQFFFTELKIDNQIDRELLIPKYPVEITTPHITHPEPLEMEWNESNWQISALPNGFKKISVMRHKLSGKPEFVDHITLSDGLATVSVFVETTKGNVVSPVKRSFPGHGAINVYTRTIAGHIVTTVGEVPLEGVIEIGNSVVTYRNSETEN